MEATSEPKEEPVATCLLDDRMDVEVIESNVAALGEVQVPESPNARDASMDIDPTPGVVEDEAKPKSIEPNNVSLPKEENAVDPGKEGCSAVREDDDSAVGPSSAAQSSDPLSKGKGKEVELDREKAQDPNEKEKPGTSPSSATQPSDPSKEEKIEFAPSARNDPNRKRSHLDFPLIDVISHLKKVAGVEYDYYEKEPRGYRTEEGFKWSLHKNDWFFIYTHRPHLATLVTRSMLHHMGMILKTVHTSMIGPQRKRELSSTVA
ncbi:hypothetical protein FRC03_004272 [Tulasnella sp. 419]|nr:hypothetical protein FRC03_004272 [Tulasnella sp. 419]